MLTHIDKTFVSPDTSILETIGAINSGAMQIALVVDAERHLLGTVTDGDVRRGLLRGIGVDKPVAEIMNTQPRTVHGNATREAVLALMRQSSIHQLPVVDDEGRVLGIQFLDNLVQAPTEDTWVVLMAGGLGTRLHPLTLETPKPLLPVGGRPLLETTVRNLVDQGFRRLLMSVNYKAEQFRAHFGDGSDFGAEIVYIEEKKRLGTAGALGLLPGQPDRPMIVMNGDVLTSVDFRQLLAFHAENHAAATMCVREHTYQVPYGVVQTENGRVTGVVEKPVHTFFVNAGIYVVDPGSLDYIPADTFFDMPHLLDALVANGKTVVPFPLREYWLDVGQMETLNRARAEFESEFG
jgi:dTDP-glucose pyrophosphorylase/predicted transcriptional regulator